MATKDHSYWTSGTNNGVGCDETWGWCSTKTLFQNPFKMWMSGAPFAQITKRCAQMTMNADPTKVVFEDYPCGSVRYFICEVIVVAKKIDFYQNICTQGDMPACTTPDCPTYACETDAAKVELSTKWKGLKIITKIKQIS
jgi:hypothetical protein